VAVLEFLIRPQLVAAAQAAVAAGEAEAALQTLVAAVVAGSLMHQTVQLRPAMAALVLLLFGTRCNYDVDRSGLMAHFAKIENDIVVDVIVVGNEFLNNLEFPESEPIGQEYLKSLGFTGEWIQTSYNNKFRYRHAGVGGQYYRKKDVFLFKKPFASWKLNEVNYMWEAPKPMPDHRSWIWNEEQQEWEDPIDPPISAI
jgi:hypothetical protein